MTFLLFHDYIEIAQQFTRFCSVSASDNARRKPLQHDTAIPFRKSASI
jgi:hypothetical protein